MRSDDPQELWMFPVYAIYERPTDYPDQWVVRSWLAVDGRLLLGGVFAAESLEAARAGLPRSDLHRLEPMPGDDPTIVETWI